MSIRTSSADSDPYKDDVFCYLTVYSTTETLLALKEERLYPDQEKISNYTQRYDRNLHTLPKISEAYKYLILDYEIKWPLNIILSKLTMIKYQVLFRHLFFCKYAERKLHQIWLNYHSLKDLGVCKELIPANALISRLMNFSKNLIYNTCYEVIEAKWKVFLKKLNGVKNFEEIITYHNNFIDGCLRESLIVDKEFGNLLAKVNTFMVLFVQHLSAFPTEIRVQSNLEPDVKIEEKFFLRY